MKLVKLILKNKQKKKLQFVLRLSLAPLKHRRVNNSLVKIVPSLHDSLMKIFNITDLCFVHHFLHASPYLIIDGIQTWAIMGPQYRIYEVRSFILSFVRTPELQPFLELCALEHHILLENVK